MTDTQKQIIRQSSLKTAVDFFKVRSEYKPGLMEVLGVTMGFEEYASTGSYEILQKVQKKLDENLNTSNL